jgi:hypothetical protein
VDCCVTDPNNIETEAVLIDRARQIHTDINFGESFESRFRKDGGTPAPADQAPVREPPRQEARIAAASFPPEPKSGERPKPAAPPTLSPKDSKQPPAKPPQVSKAIKAEKHFPGEVSTSFKELRLQFEKKGPLTRPLPRILIFLLQPLLGALPHQVKKDLERAVQSPVSFSTVGSTGLNILMNIILYPLIFMGAAAVPKGLSVLFSQSINVYLLSGLFLGFLEAVYRLREGIFHVRPAEEMTFPSAVYGVPLFYALKPLMTLQRGIIRSAPIPVDGFYGKGFVEKMERERRYGNVYTIEDWGRAYLLRVEFPTKVPDIGHPLRSELPDEMPDYDYDLVLKDGHFIVRGRCTDERVRKISSSVGAFPPEFTTVIPLHERVDGFSHRFEDKVLEVLLLKKETPKGRERNHL